jgi:SanA protein
MREALIRAGVPGHVIFTDHAGFNTYATMVRAKRIFEVSSAIVVTQGFHIDRALYLAKSAGIGDVQGLTSDLHGYGRKQTESDVRELLARPKALFDTATDASVMGGAQIPITGDGRASWGPKPPPGTPPAGAPQH